MRSKASKLAAAVIFVVAVLLSVTVFDAGTSRAYAVEQTIDAVKNVRFMHIVMKTDEGKTADERWIEIGDDGLQKRYRQESDRIGQKVTIIDDRKTVFYHDKVKNEVTLYAPAKKQYQWIGDLGEFFEEVRGAKTLTVQENVEYKGRAVHEVRWLNQSCLIDADSYLPIALGGYDIYYDKPENSIFEIPELPEGAKIVDERNGHGKSSSGRGVVNEDVRAAKAALGTGRYSEAIELFGKVVEAEQMNNWAWFWMGDAYMGMGDFDAAVECYGKVIEMFEQFKLVAPYAHMRRGLAYRAKGLEDQANKDLGVAIGVMIDSLRHPDEMKLFDYADDLSKSCKEVPENIRAYRMIERLRKVTGQEFGYEAEHDLAGNEKTIREWQKWWSENAREYGVE